MPFRSILFSIFLTITFCQKEIKSDDTPTSQAKPHLEGRLPGADWLEIHPETVGAIQAFAHKKFPEAALFLYIKKTKDKPADFMKQLALNLNKEGYEITPLENQILKNGIWLNFLAEKPNRLSRVFAKKQKDFLLWAIVKSRDLNQLALLSVEVERYLGNLAIVD